MATQSPAWWTPQEVADYHRMPVNEVWRKIRRGEIRALNRGRGRRRLYLVSANEIRRIDQHGFAA
jgi:hypothetical protein